MTTTTDRLVASPKTEPTPGNCWVLVDDKGREYDNGDSVQHYVSEARATEEAPVGFTPRQLDVPCRTLTCSCCETVLDEEGFGQEIHCLTSEEFRDTLDAYSWTRAADGSLKCEPCAAGDCDECASEARDA